MERTKEELRRVADDIIALCGQDTLDYVDACEPLIRKYINAKDAARKANIAKLSLLFGAIEESDENETQDESEENN